MKVTRNAGEDEGEGVVVGGNGDIEANELPIEDIEMRGMRARRHALVHLWGIGVIGGVGGVQHELIMRNV